MENKSMVCGIWGEDKSTKTTLALSFPKPLVVMEIDIGGFDRANRNLPHLPIKDWYNAGLIKYEPYAIPLQGMKIDPVTKQVIFASSKTITGIKELFYELVNSYFKHLKDPNIKSIVVDTGTLLYNSLVCDGYLQELQERAVAEGKPPRASLIQIEYKEPYDRMRGIVYQAKAFHKNLILTHHASDEYKPMPQRDGGIAVTQTGKRQRHGWGQLGDAVDLMIHTYTKPEPVIDPATNKPAKPASSIVVPYGQVELSTVLEMVGIEYRVPTFEMLDSTMRMIRGEL